MSETKATPTLLTPREVQARLRLGRNAVYALARDREISSVRIGRKLLFSEPDIEAYVKRRTTPAKRQFFGSHSQHP